MALEPNELWDANESKTIGLRISPDKHGGSLVKEFAIDAGAPKLPVGCPVARNSSTLKWVLWASAGANDTNKIAGFVYPKPVQLSAAYEVQGVVMTKGEIDYSQVKLPTGSAETEADLKTALKASLGQIGLIVRRLPGTL